MALSPGGTMVAISAVLSPQGDLAGGGKIQVLDAAKGKCLCEFDRLGTDTLLFTPDDRYLISLDSAGSLHIADLASKTEFRQRALDARASNGLALSPDGSLLAIASARRSSVYLWNWRNEDDVKAVSILEGADRLSFSPDGKLLAASTVAGGPIAIWDLEKATLRHLLSTGKYLSQFGSARFSPDGKHLLAPVRRRPDSMEQLRDGIQVWSVETGEPERLIPGVGDSPEAICFSRDGSWLGAASGNRLHVWNWATGVEMRPVDGGHAGSITEIAVGRSVVVTAGQDQTVRFWDLATGQQLHKADHRAWVLAVALSADESLAASSSLDNSVRVWDVRDGKEIYRLPGHGELSGRQALRFTPDGRFLVSFGDDYYLRKWDLRTGKAVAEFKLEPPELEGERNEAWRQMAFISGLGPLSLSPDASRVVRAFNTSIKLFDARSGRELQSLENLGPGRQSSAAISPGNEFVAVTTCAQEMLVSQVEGGHRSRVTGQVVGLWRISTGKLIHRLQLPESSSSPVAFTPDGKCLVTVTDKIPGRIAFLSLPDGKEIRAIEGLPERVSGLGFSPDGKRLVAGFRDTTALVWVLRP
jgi:WD40 repeat protein